MTIYKSPYENGQCFVKIINEETNQGLALAPFSSNFNADMAVILVQYLFASLGWSEAKVITEKLKKVPPTDWKW